MDIGISDSAGRFADDAHQPRARQQLYVRKQEDSADGTHWFAGVSAVYFRIDTCHDNAFLCLMDSISLSYQKQQ